MAKKEKKPTVDEQVEVITPDEKVEETKVSKKDKKSKEKDVQVADKSSKAKSAKNSKGKNSNKKERVSLKKRMSETWSELKKVSMPSFGKVVKNTCVVISVVAICTLLLFGIDKLFSLLYDLLLP